MDGSNRAGHGACNINITWSCVFTENEGERKPPFRHDPLCAAAPPPTTHTTCPSHSPVSPPGCRFIFPCAPWVVSGRERGSGTNRQYALRDLPPNDLRGDDAARAFLRYRAEGVDLRGNYLAITAVLADHLENGKTLLSVVGGLDDPKVRSSLLLFERVTRGGWDDEMNTVCMRALTAAKQTSDPDSE